MKFALIVPLVSLPLVSGALAQPVQKVVPPDQAADGVYRVVELGPHQKTWQKIVEVQDENGFLQPRTNSYVELGTGLNRFDQAKQEWTEASDEIEILEEGAIARKSQHHVSFAGNLNDPNGTIDMLTPDGQRIRSRVIGLAYTEIDTGMSVFIAEAKDSQGFVLGRNQVIYLDAFDSIKADVRYLTTKSSFEADVILREQLPDAAELGMRPEAVRIELWTQMWPSAGPTITAVARKRQDGQQEQDVALDFGAMRIGPGKAFSLANQEQADPLQREHDAIPVSKEWAAVAGKQFLIESVPYLEAIPEIEKLPEPQARGRIKQPRQRLLAAQAMGRHMPVSMSEKPSGRRRNMEVARLDKLATQPGYCLDWISLTTASNVTLKGDTTYFVSGMVNLTGVTTIEGGSVVKVASYDAANPAAIYVLGSLDCRTSSYRPAIFTAKDDNTIGETISGSSGTPSGDYGRWYLHLACPAAFVQNLQLRHAYVGCYFASYSGHLARHLQFVNCSFPIDAWYTDVNVQNVLFHKGKTSLQSWNTTFKAEHLTLGEASAGGYSAFHDRGSAVFYVTNSLFAAVASLGSISGSNNATNSSTNGVFQPVGAGNYYLAASSPYRNAGTTAINAQLLADLKKKTTYPPSLLTSPITANTTLSPQAQRDTDVPDLGFHYDPLDWLASNVSLTAVTLMLTNGAALGLHGSTGIELFGGGKIVSEGTPVSLNRIVRYNTVQENPIASDSYIHLIYCAGSYSPTPEVQLRFTQSSLLPSNNGSTHIHAPSSGNISISLQDGFFHSGAMLASGSGVTLGVNNCWTERVLCSLQGPTLSLYNNTFHNGTILLTAGSGQSLTVKDNFFDCDTLSASGMITAANNGYRSGLTAISGESSPKTGLVPDYQAGPMANHLGRLGNYYYPASGGSTSLFNLVNAGSRTASAAGLYHYTTRTDQTKDSSTVDIGFHYIALNGSNQPMDNDQDTFPDYLEDRNGNGVFDSGSETDWNTYNSPNGLTGNPGMQVFTPLK